MSQREVNDHYETLGVASNATPKDINSAYKRLALKHHPDKAGGGDMDEFQKVQQAAEVLRDPYRRRRHDHELRALRVRKFHTQQGPGSAFGAGANASNGFYSRWMPSSVGSYNMGSRGYRYMYSYANSVHMNPGSRGSVDERERCARERKLDEELRQRTPHHDHSTDEVFKQAAQRRPGQQFRMRPEDKSWETRRQEAMRARVVRDEEELEGEGKQEKDLRGKKGEVEEQEAEEQGAEPDEKDGDEQKNDYIRTSFVDEEDEQESEDEDEDEDEGDSSEISYDIQSMSEYMTAQEENEVSDSDCDAESYIYSPKGAGVEKEDTAISYDCKESHLPNNTDTDSQDEQSLGSETSDEGADDDNDDDDEEEGEIPEDNNSNDKTTSPFAPFIPYFMEKLKEPSGKYSEEDLHVELHGIVMETFCGWLEASRLTFPNEKPQQRAATSSSEDTSECLHLGYWKKKFNRPECEACHRWKPIYTLTCRGCETEACVGCKFQGKDKF